MVYARLSERQRKRTVNPPAYAFVGSNQHLAQTNSAKLASFALWGEDALHRGSVRVLAAFCWHHGD